MIFLPHIKMATQSLRANKVRTFLTLLGIIIGVMSVTTIIGLGQGVKKQVNEQINSLGGDLITISPGKNEQSGTLRSILNGSISSTARLSDKDLASLGALDNVKQASGVMRLEGSISQNGVKKVSAASILAVDDNYLAVTGQKLTNGQFFGDGLNNNQSVILASNVANELFGDQNPIGSTITIRGKDFVIVGVLDAYKGFNFGQPVNDRVLIPLAGGKAINQNSMQFQQISLKLDDVNQTKQTATAAKQTLLQNHGGEEDFTITTQDQLANTTDDVFKVFTGFTAAIASISLLVGGIGVMNIMLVTVTERTREIGIRKAIGATRFQIMMQFLTEALMITLAGGVIGILLSIIISFIIRSQTAIKPSLDLWVVALATGVSIIVGVIFGTWPAIRAARKDPIEALRHD